MTRSHSIRIYPSVYHKFGDVLSKAIQAKFVGTEVTFMHNATEFAGTHTNVFLEIEITWPVGMSISVLALERFVDDWLEENT